MKASLSWLKRYVDIDVSIDELCRRMPLAGFEIEELIDLSATMNNVVVAKILSIEKHPDSDHLHICQMDVGAEAPIQIITGAQNVSVGDLVPAALHDSHLPNGAHIKKGKLRGLPSNGMLCSGGELMLTEADYPGAEVDGILILKKDCAPVGTDMRDLLGLNDYVIDFSITANRPDCQSVLGIAREIAAVLGKEIKKPDVSNESKGGNINDYINVSVLNFDLCPRYYGRVVKNVRIKESPDWMKRCLISAGMRPINNIVDITNFVMLETGQPMHAFDLADVRNGKIIVRNAVEGESITTLDGKKHMLSSEMLVIADGEAPSCIAGVMGGIESEIEENTGAIFFECAKFRRDSVRKTSRKLGVRTESSGRFERGVDIINVEFAMNRALNLVEELDAGDIVEGVIDLHNGLPESRKLDVSVEKVNTLLGISICGSTMVSILNNLGISTSLDGDTLHCLVPSQRDDIEGTADIAEEVMRIYGYDHVVGTTMSGAVVRGNKLPERKKADRIKQTLCSIGAYEIYTYSFIGNKTIDTLNLTADDPRRKAVTIINPLGDEYSNMRTQLATSMLTVLAQNYTRKIPAARLFELSKIFVPKQLPVTEQPEERPTMSIGMYGSNEDFFTLKGIVKTVVNLFAKHVETLRANEPYLHPGRSAITVVNGKKIATYGEVHPAVAAAYGIETRCYIAEIDLAELYALPETRMVYKPLPRFPAVSRDIALVCDESITVGELETAIEQGAGKLLEEIQLFDVYRSPSIGIGKKSVAFSLILRADYGTLNEEETDAVMNKILNKLEMAGATLRS